jgi:hypothetical protein
VGFARRIFKPSADFSFPSSGNFPFLFGSVLSSDDATSLDLFAIVRVGTGGSFPGGKAAGASS